jgi:hypothetical protein
MINPMKATRRSVPKATILTLSRQTFSPLDQLLHSSLKLVMAGTAFLSSLSDRADNFGLVSRDKDRNSPRLILARLFFCRSSTFSVLMFISVSRLIGYAHF